MSKVGKYLAGNLILKQTEQLGALVLGDCNSAMQLTVLKPNKIKTIVSIGLQAMPPKQRIPQDIIHHFYDIHDNKQQKLPVQLLDEVVSLIHKGREEGGVLVHCYAGVSRSSTFVIAYVMSTYNLDYYKAKQKVKKYRPCVHPGDGFVRQLQHYQKVLQQREIERLALLAEQNKPKEEPIKFKIEIKQQKIKQETVVPIVSRKKKRGVGGGVKSAEKGYEGKQKSPLKDISQHQRTKIVQRQKSEQANSPKIKQQKDRLPPINVKVQVGIGQSRYERTASSRLQLKRNIQKIQGKSLLIEKKSKESSTGIYKNKIKIM